MRNIFKYLIIASTVLLSGCYSSVKGIWDYDDEYYQIVFINKCSETVRVSISDASWISPQDTIVLKPECGLWKHNIYDDYFYFSSQCMEIRYGDREPLVYDLYSDIPHNPGSYSERKSLYDNKGEYMVFEFTDQKRDAIYKQLDDRKNFSMFSFGYPDEIPEAFTAPGSSETYFYCVYPVSSLHDKLSLGVAVKKEAETVDKITIVEDVKFTPSSVYNSTDLGETLNYFNSKKYYFLSHLQKASLANFGCDFVALTGRTPADMTKKCGVAATKVFFDKEDYFDDTTAPEELLAVADELAFVKRIQYGNIMILLIESDLSPNYVSDQLYYGELLEHDGIDYYLITLDEAGEFICEATGEDALHKYRDGFDAPSIHPISFTTTDFSGLTSLIHVNDIVVE